MCACKWLIDMLLLLFCGQSGCVEDSVVNLSAMSTFKGTKEASQVSEGHSAHPVLLGHVALPGSCLVY